MKKTLLIFFLLLTTIILTPALFGGAQAQGQYSYTIDSIKVKSATEEVLDKIPDDSFSLEAVAAAEDNAPVAEHLLFAIYGQNGVLSINFAEGFTYEDNKLVFSARIPKLKDKAELVKAFIWDKAFKPLSLPGVLDFSEDTEDKTKVATISNILFKEQGVYIKMEIEPPQDETGIVSYEAIIYNKNNPEQAVHRSVPMKDMFAYYRLDYDDIFAVGDEYNTVKITSIASEGYSSSDWIRDISIVPVQKDIVITDVVYLDKKQLNLTLQGLNKGYIGWIFTKEDGTVIHDEYFSKYNGGSLIYSSEFKSWSEEEIAMLEKGEVYVSITGMNILKMEPEGEKWVVEFERIKSPRIKIQ